MSECHRDGERYMLRTHLRDCTDRACEGCQPCTTDANGNPTRHCEARYRCTSHLGWGEHACPDCLGTIRRNLRAILDAMALMPPEAEETGVDSAAASLAGPVANRVAVSWHLINADRAGQVVEELDEREPYTALTLRERMVREELGQDLDTLVSRTLAGTVRYLDLALTDLARDPDQVLVVNDLLATSARVRDYVEGVLRDSRRPEQGAPCPECVMAEVAAPEKLRLRRRYGHFCIEPDCDREHTITDERDTWVCPRNPQAHWWTHAAYSNWIEARGRARDSAP